MNQMIIDPLRGALVGPLGAREASKVATRRRLIASAQALLLERGYEAATLRDVAAGADRSVGAVFTCFSDKLDLFEAAVAEAAGKLAREAQSVTSGSPDLADAIHRLHALLIERQSARLVLIDRDFPSSRRGVQPALCAILMDLLVEARARGEIAASVQLTVLCGLIWDLLTARCADALDADADQAAPGTTTCAGIDLLIAAIRS